MRLSFDAMAAHFDTQRGLPREALGAWIGLIDELSNSRKLNIVEPGIGTGRIALPLAAMGHSVSGTDISQPMLDACKSSIQELGVSNAVDLSLADATDLPYGDHSFDLGVVAQLLYLVPDWPSVLDELARVVKPGGHVIHLTEPTTESNALAAWSSIWREMIEATGYQHTTVAPSDTDVQAEFLRRWPDVSTRQLASWTFGQTVAEAIEGYANRLRPLYDSVPQDSFDDAVAQFLDWAREYFPNQSTRLDGAVSLTALIAKT